MPAEDGTGPMGRGPMTGRGAGYCGDYDAPGWAKPVPGRGFGSDFGRGYGAGGAWGGARGGRGGGWRHRNVFYATGVPGWARSGSGPAWEGPPDWRAEPYAQAPSPEQETEVLRQQAEWLKQQLDAIGRRIEELGKEE